MRKDLDVLLKAFSDLGETDCPNSDPFLYRGIHSVCDAAIETLISNQSAMLDNQFKKHASSQSKLESWTSDSITAKKFAMRSNGNGIVFKKRKSTLLIGWESKLLSELLPGELKKKYYDLMDLEEEVVVHQKTNLVSLSDVLSIYKGSNLVWRNGAEYCLD